MATADTTNSFCTYDLAEVYFDERLHSSAWTSASDDDKERALIQATRMLETYLEWYEVVDKENVPDVVMQACCELALVLLGGDLMVRNDMEGLKVLSVDGVVTMETAGSGKKKLIPDHVRLMLGDLVTSTGGSVTIVRT